MTWTTRQRSEVGGVPAIQAGNGPNVLFLHGVGLRAEAWSKQLDTLSSNARVTAPDMLGHGESKSHNGAQMSDFVAVARAVLLALEGPTLIVGHSMGSMIALELAARAPDRIVAVAALNAVFERSPAAARAVQNRAASLDGATVADPAATLDRWFGTTKSPERDACGSWLKSVSPAAYKAAYTAFAHSDIPKREALSNLQCPALFITGSLEPNSTPAMSEDMAARAPHGRALIIDGAAHMMPMTHATTVNPALRHFTDEAHLLPYRS